MSDGPLDARRIDRHDRYHYGHIAQHFGSLAGLAFDALQTTFKHARLARCSPNNHKKERGTLAALCEWLETKPPWSAILLPVEHRTGRDRKQPLRERPSSRKQV
jgi:hypothetical protein